MTDSIPAEWHGTDYYAVLGISQVASADEIRAAYRRVAKHTHPDAGPAGDADAFDRAAKAYEVLSSPGTRAAYDRFRHATTEEAEARRADAENFRRARARQAAHEEAARRSRRSPPEGIRWEGLAFTRLFQPIYSQPGPDRYVDARPRQSEAATGFWQWVADDVGYVPILPNTPPGLYVFPGLGGAGAFGGPRGNLYVRVRWEPRRGRDASYAMPRPGKEKWADHTFRSPVDGRLLTIRSGTDETVLRYPEGGWEGEFGGERGDLVIDYFFIGEPRSHAAHVLLKSLAALPSLLTTLVKGAVVIALAFALCLLLYVLLHRT